VVRTFSANNAAKQTLKTPPNKLDKIIQLNTDNGAVLMVRFSMALQIKWIKQTDEVSIILNIQAKP
jgi:hypothetical protein